MNDIIAGTRVEGRVLIDGDDIYGPRTDVVALRRRVGMVFQKSNPFPKSIFENIAYGIRLNGLRVVAIRAARTGRGEPQGSGDLGRSQGSPARLGACPVRRSAAAAVHRARARGQTARSS